MEHQLVWNHPLHQMGLSLIFLDLLQLESQYFGYLHQPEKEW